MMPPTNLTRHPPQVDNVVMMGAGAGNWQLNRALEVYRDTVNANMQFVNVDLMSVLRRAASHWGGWGQIGVLRALMI